MGNVIAFPQHRVSRVFAGTLPEGATAREEAIFHVRQLRAEQARHIPIDRAYHTTGIMLAWWEAELSRIVGSTSEPVRLDTTKQGLARHEHDKRPVWELNHAGQSYTTVAGRA